MKMMQRVKLVIVCMATVGSMIPNWARAANYPVAPQPAAPAIADVALHDGGRLLVQTVDAQGIATAGQTVSVWQDNRQLGMAVSDKEGHLVVAGLRGGVYQVRSGENAALYRLWAPQTAPPAAQPGVLMVNGQHVFRGQSPVGSFFANPWVWGTIIAAAITIPIALSNNDKKSGS
jgi:hypothetical protein